MGASESCPQTPTCKPLLNKHLAQVSDPRSPTAGILRTPIEVQSSPQASPLGLASENGLAVHNQDLTCDPRSPTPGISRTPMKDVVSAIISCPVKQLSDMFVAENEEELLSEESCHQGQKLDMASVVETALQEQPPPPPPPHPLPPPEALLEGSLRVEEKDEQPASVAAAARPTHLSGVLPPTGSKPARRRANSKLLAMSTGAGRSPLSVLLDDNSPGSLSSLQGKTCLSMADSQGDRKEAALSSGRSSLKAGSCSSWQSLNKENQQLYWVGN